MRLSRGGRENRKQNKPGAKRTGKSPQMRGEETIEKTPGQLFKYRMGEKTLRNMEKLSAKGDNGVRQKR